MMKRISLTVVLFILVLIFPFQTAHSQIRYYKGNTHAHTTNSDGVLSLNDLIKKYKDLQYDFLVVTDHNILADAELLSTPDFLIINGEEVTGSTHITAIGLKEQIPWTSSQNVIDSINAQGALPVINHPRRTNTLWTASQLLNTSGVSLIEIFNASNERRGYHDDHSLWDEVLTSGKMLYGVASDDTHLAREIGQAWIMVLSPSLDKDHIIDAIRKGNFYASTGILIDDMHYSNGSVYVKSRNGSAVKFIGKNGLLLTSFTGCEGRYAFKGDEKYIRVEAEGASGKKAWTQPFFIHPGP